MSITASASRTAGHRAALAPTRVALENGVVVTARQTRKTPAVTVNLAVKAGSIFDPPDAAGATNLLARVIDRGTATRPAAQIAEEFDNRGISLNVVVNRHLFSAVCTCLADDFDAVFELLGDILMNPAIPDIELAKRKAEAVTAIRQDEDNPAVQAVERLMATLYPDGHPYGRRQKGTIDAMEALTRDQLLALHAARFRPAAVSAVVVGDVESAAVVAAAQRIFGSWPEAPASGRPQIVPLTSVAPATGRQRIVIPMMNKAQADIAYGFTTITRSDPSYYAYWLMNNVLGQYALGGRLGQNIRERQGMAYYVSSALDANVIEGPLVIRAGVSPANVDRAVAAIDDEMARLRTEGVTGQELAESRQFLVGSMPRALETNAGIAQFLQSAEFFGLGLDYDLRLPELLGAVTLEQVIEAARQAVDPERAAVVIAGPYQGT